jgi:hypothetical protein
VNPAPTLHDFLHALASSDDGAAAGLLDTAPALALERSKEGARRGAVQSFYAPALGCYLNEGDAALHLAAAAWRADLISRLVALGADVCARNRMGATPLHHAASGNPQSPRWNPVAQAAAIKALVVAGVDVNAVDKHGATALHRAVRTRCAAATQALLDTGADPAIPTRNGSTPLHLAQVTSGRGGSGSAAAKAQQALIVEMLERRTA